MGVNGFKINGVVQKYNYSALDNINVESGHLVDGCTTAAKIADGAVTTNKIGNQAVTEAKIADGAVTTNKIGNQAVTAAKIADATITKAKIANKTITAAQIADATITAPKIADGSVTTNKIGNQAVTEAKIADGAVTTAKINDSAVTTAKINKSAVTTVKIADDSVTKDKLKQSGPNSIFPDIEAKANINGSYDDMTVGAAKQLLSSTGTDDQIPYCFRPTGGSIDSGDRKVVSALVGGTVVWNQLIQNGDFASTSEWTAAGGQISASNNKLTLESAGTSPSLRTSFVTSPDHVYLFNGYIEPNDDDILRLDFILYGKTTNHYSVSNNYVMNTYRSLISAGTRTNIATIIKPKEGYNAFWIRPNYQISVQDYAYIFDHINAFDLTLMFGDVIADYIYDLEQTSEGSGISWFRRLFPNYYYGYDAGSFLSVKTTEHRLTGFNQWDEQWEEGDINSATGVNGASSDRWRSKNYIRIVPNTKYYASSQTASAKNINVRFYDSAKNYLGNRDANSRPVFTGDKFVTPKDAHYMRFAPNPSDIPNHDICVNISRDGRRNGEYEAYSQRSYDLDSLLQPLNGIPKLDAQQSLYYDGDEYLSDGTVIRKYGEVDLGTRTFNKITFSHFSAGYVFKINGIPDMKSASTNLRCTKYPVVDGLDFGSVLAKYTSFADKLIYVANSGNVYIIDSSFSDATSLQNSLSGEKLIYERADALVGSAATYAQEEAIDQFGTEEYVDNRTVSMPVGHITRYSKNLKSKVEMLPNLPSDGDGDYVLRQANGQAKYTRLVVQKELPDFPSENGTYRLNAIVTDDEITISWEAVQ